MKNGCPKAQAIVTVDWAKVYLPPPARKKLGKVDHGVVRGRDAEEERNVVVQFGKNLVSVPCSAISSSSGGLDGVPKAARRRPRIGIVPARLLTQTNRLDADFYIGGRASDRVRKAQQRLKSARKELKAAREAQAQQAQERRRLGIRRR